MSKDKHKERNKKTVDTCSADTTCSCSHTQSHSHSGVLHKKELWAISVSLLLLLIGMLFTYTSLHTIISLPLLTGVYALAYLPVAYPVLKEAYQLMYKSHDFFNEFSLMSLATLGAFAIGEYPEAVAVMLLYSIGELFQGRAVNKATKNIEALLDVRVDEARILTESGVQTISSESVKVGDHLQVRVGDKSPVDAVLLSDKSSFNTVALTGESVPRTIYKGEPVLAGMINLSQAVEIKATKAYKDSTLSQVLELVEHATARKAQTELLIRNLARWYTPLVFGLAVLVTILPALFVTEYIFRDWLYRALVFLVISCPCAIVISIPLSYFGGIGAASRYGILFKGANFIDVMNRANVLVLDKTGTITKGIFEVQQVETTIDTAEFMNLLSSIESHSSHPIAQAILRKHQPNNQLISELTQVKELAGYGIACLHRGKEVLVGNSKLLNKYGISFPTDVSEHKGTVIRVAYDGRYIGFVLIADQIKSDSAEAIRSLRSYGISKVVLLSGDAEAITQKVGQEVGVDQSYGSLLPNEKVAHLEVLQQEKDDVVCFVGDGINDAPALALSDVGVAMGAMGSDMAIEVADVVIQTDQLSKLVKAKKIAKATRNIVFQNIALAICVKSFVLLLGAVGIATMWEAVLADVGVTILAVLNAVRLLYKRY